MKKKYLKPEITIYKMECQQQILAGSSLDDQFGSRYMQFAGDADEDDEAL